LKQASDNVHPSRARTSLTDFLLLLLITAAAFAIQGYHPAVEDAEIYVPQIQKLLHPELFPFGAEFFETHARLTLFPNLIAATSRLLHLPLGWTLLGWQLLAIFLLLLACHRLAGVLFTERAAQWSAIALVAGVMTIPVAGTALYIFDEYINPRSIALFAALFALDSVLRRRYGLAAAWMALAALIHPLMSVFALSLIAVILWLRDFGGMRLLHGTAGASGISGKPGGGAMAAGALALLPLGLSLRQPSPAYRAVIQMRPYFFILEWRWYEWIGLIAPIAVLVWLAWQPRRRSQSDAVLLCRALVIYEVVYFSLALVMTIPPRFLALVRYQPLRSLQLLYVLLFLVLGGWLGQTLLRKRVLAWVALFAPLAVGMFIVQGQIFPATPHVEWPGLVPANDWLQAFAWIRGNTPQNAIFALNPYHMELRGEDEHGFRASTQRSMLVDAVKDSGALTMFPDLPLAETWEAEMKTEAGWERFQTADFARLRRDWGVTWVVLDQPNLTLPDCPYANRTLRVCKLDDTFSMQSSGGSAPAVAVNHQ
jgi:hypothetical protein